jgi:hypothetical protein
MLLSIKKILSPTDFSEPYLMGIEAVIELAGYFSAELILISVLTPIDPATAPGVPVSYKAEE